jgi:hypothetical protein
VCRFSIPGSLQNDSASSKKGVIYFLFGGVCLYDVKSLADHPKAPSFTLHPRTSSQVVAQFTRLAKLSGGNHGGEKRVWVLESALKAGAATDDINAWIDTLAGLEALAFAKATIKVRHDLAQLS